MSVSRFRKCGPGVVGTFITARWLVLRASTPAKGLRGEMAPFFSLPIKFTKNCDPVQLDCIFSAIRLSCPQPSGGPWATPPPRAADMKKLIPIFLARATEVLNADVCNLCPGWDGEPPP